MGDSSLDGLELGSHKVSHGLGFIYSIGEFIRKLLYWIGQTNLCCSSKQHEIFIYYEKKKCSLLHVQNGWQKDSGPKSVLTYTYTVTKAEKEKCGK